MTPPETGWQKFLDDTFPDGALVAWDWGDRETDPIMKVPRFIVLEDTVTPLVWYHAIGLPVPFDEIVSRFVGWTVVQSPHASRPLVVETAREDGMRLRIAQPWTEGAKAICRNSLGARRPPAWMFVPPRLNEETNQTGA